MLHLSFHKPVELLKSVTWVYHKVCQILQSALGVTKCERQLLESA